jgi:hypothetical protein
LLPIAAWSVIVRRIEGQARRIGTRADAALYVAIRAQLIECKL